MILFSTSLPMRGVYGATSLTVLTLAALTLATPARADRCDDLAKQLKAQIDGIGIGKTAANMIYLSHPAAKALRLGCPSRTVKNEIYGQASARKPSPEFQDLIASAAAIVFTIPKPDTLRGVKRCFGRVGILRGNDIKTRFRRLDMRCTRTKTDASISITRDSSE
ncbi:hypothetical protein D4Q71_15470 [Rhodopseudomonas palustris]|uniref:Uncharacterized protein n=2 Tax=Rhodopseudomonas palustris (strain ATCC BAA-98 / CGA009) TaxID=258594 RepID=Q6N317_RHOPA|nr:hypothetical protein CKO39_23560 [Rhodopseudomonas palustris]RJF63199.1 hypothetical protein D4Q71_15470 [Rhodopseudomonas palustris]CAE29319.1 conserved unknown protein [Rhodopseudomonas palustris CGA009]